jgi:hypothetical protein
VAVFIEDQKLNAKLNFYFKYLQLEQPGPVINGTIVIQGSVLIATHGPAFCKVEYAADHDEAYRHINNIMPWEMMYTHPIEEEVLLLYLCFYHY